MSTLAELSQRLARLEELVRYSPGLRSAYVGDNVVLVRTELGKRIYVDGRDSVIAPQLMVRGEWEGHNTALFKRVLKPGMRVIDVGANYGYFTILAAHLVGTSGQVHAVEPNPETLALLERSLRVNGLKPPAVQLHRLALSDQAGNATLRYQPGNTGGGHLRGGPQRTPPAHKAEVEVPTQTGDALFAQFAPFDLIKIDAEGHEPLIWDGLAQTIAASPRLQVLMELSPSWIARIRPVDQFIGQLDAAGFKCHPIVDGNEPKPVRWADYSRGEFGYVLLKR